MRIRVSEAIYRSGLSRVIGWRYQGRGVIFMLHSIVDDPREFLNDPLRCAPRTLELALRWARETNLDIVSMDEAVQRLEIPNARRFAAFTFDDGYRDNITRALPLFESFDAPLTIYITTGMITRQLYSWWDGLAILLRDNDSVDIEAMGRIFDIGDFRAKAAALTTIKHWIHLDGTRAEHLRPVFSRHGVDIEALVDSQALTLEEMKRASAHPLVTIGGHSMSHSFLTLETDERVFLEISANKAFLEHEIEAPVMHFSYPYGAAGVREVECVKKAGFKTAVTTRNGTAFLEHAQECGAYELPREAVNTHETIGSLDCRSRGVYRFLRSRAGNPIMRLEG